MKEVDSDGFKVILHLVGWVFLGVSFSQVIPLAAAFYYSEPLTPFLAMAGLGVLVGAPLTRFPVKEDLRSGEVLAFVVVTWVAVPLMGTVPYLLSGTFPSLAAAFFESMSGFTTTGSTVLTDFGQPRSVLIWRQFTQWLGGMGIIVLFIAILPRLSVGGRQLMEAEAPGPAVEKITPRIRDTAKLLWVLYVGFTLGEVVLLLFTGLSPYDAISHAFTTMPTGGFSPRPGGIAEFGLVPRAIIVFFMFLAGVNFALTYRAFSGSLKKFLEDAEFVFYGKVTLFGASALAVASYFLVYGSVAESLVNGAFQAVTIITSTGYATADFTAWPGGLQAVLVMLMFTGGSAGSTGGGIKMVRLLVLKKLVSKEIVKSLHPRAITTLTLNGTSVSDGVVKGMAAFIAAYFALFLGGTAAISVLSGVHGLEIGVLDAASSSIATLGNIGPGLGNVGPMDNFAYYPPDVKVLLSFLMLAGRLEVLTVLVLFAPSFWRE